MLYKDKNSVAGKVMSNCLQVSKTLGYVALKPLTGDLELLNYSRQIEGQQYAA